MNVFDVLDLIVRFLAGNGVYLLQRVWLKKGSRPQRTVIVLTWLLLVGLGSSWFGDEVGKMILRLMLALAGYGLGLVLAGRSRA